MQFGQNPNTCSCNTQNPNCMPTQVNCVHKQFIEDVPVHVNFHTHTVNTVVRRHYIVPTYTESCETVFVNECGQRRW